MNTNDEILQGIQDDQSGKFAPMSLVLQCDTIQASPAFVEMQAQGEGVRRALFLSRQARGA